MIDYLATAVKIIQKDSQETPTLTILLDVGLDDSHEHRDFVRSIRMCSRSGRALGGENDQVKATDFEWYLTLVALAETHGEFRQDITARHVNTVFYERLVMKHDPFCTPNSVPFNHATIQEVEKAIVARIAGVTQYDQYKQLVREVATTIQQGS